MYFCKTLPNHHHIDHCGQIVRTILPCLQYPELGIKSGLIQSFTQLLQVKIGIAGPPQLGRDRFLPCSFKRTLAIYLSFDRAL
jgi:hypothetical protein